ncbi:MAG: 2-C-methyl-D-erythritol 4-phosphate cytidylyltransferase [Lachnospiraceae bacterium]|nr:2-C-methyl-D-erythritol 4-phosphate cytidylyltransferase [Lachnospiraceae bacterium]
MNIALILSGGTGMRMGRELPKQYIEAGGKPILFYCLESLSVHPEIDAIQIVAEPKWQPQILKWMEEFGGREKFRGFSGPGKNRQLSIYQGLCDLMSYAEESDYVLIHDAARPMLSERLITQCFREVAGHDGVIPVLPMKDTVYLSRDKRTVAALLNRREVYAGQAPEVFQLGAYYEANQRLLPEQILEIHGSTEPAVMAGMDIAIIPGDEENFKITTKADLKRFWNMIEDLRTSDKEQE